MGAVEMTECLLISEGKTMTKSWTEQLAGCLAVFCRGWLSAEERSRCPRPAELRPHGAAPAGTPGETRPPCFMSQSHIHPTLQGNLMGAGALPLSRRGAKFHLQSENSSA